MTKIYTKTGDLGTTSLVDGNRVSKTDPRLHATGSVDELNSVLGVAIAHMQAVPLLYVAELHEIQNELFNLGSRLGCQNPQMLEKLPLLDNSHVERLEKWIDQHEGRLPALRHFILPGGSSAAAFLHLARTVCRRAERLIWEFGDKVEPILPKYLNRLSDYLFVLARVVNSLQGVSDQEWKK